MAVNKVDDANFQEEVLNSSIPVLVDFWAEWCGPCRMLAPIVESVSTAFEGKVKVCKLNTDESPQTAQKMQITGIPCCIVFKDGHEAGRIVGFKPEDTFTEELEALI
ncbi:thioredoxin [bacterium]|jgi:thioredoxin 1|nr:thioredoxin [bacterium]